MGVSYGGTRHLTFTSTTKKNPFKLKIKLEHGYAYWVSFITNQTFYHKIPIENGAKERISLTYRNIDFQVKLNKKKEGVQHFDI